MAQRRVAGLAMQGRGASGPGKPHGDDLGTRPRRRPAHEQDRVAEQDRLVDVMGYHQHRLRQSRAQIEQLVLQARARAGIQGAEGFIEQQDLGFYGKRACHAHPLAHPPRQPRRTPVQDRQEIDEPQVSQAVRAYAFATPPGPARPDREAHIVEHAQPWKQRVVLKDESAIEPGAAHLAAINEHRSGVGGVEAGHEAQERRLSTARRSEHTGDLAARHRKIDPGQHRRGPGIRRAMGLLQPFDPQKSLGHAHVS